MTKWAYEFSYRMASTAIALIIAKILVDLMGIKF